MSGHKIIKIHRDNIIFKGKGLTHASRVAPQEEENNELNRRPPPTAQRRRLPHTARRFPSSADRIRIARANRIQRDRDTNPTPDPTPFYEAQFVMNESDEDMMKRIYERVGEETTRNIYQPFNDEIFRLEGIEGNFDNYAHDYNRFLHNQTHTITPREEEHNLLVEDLFFNDQLHNEIERKKAVIRKNLVEYADINEAPYVLK